MDMVNKLHVFGHFEDRAQIRAAINELQNEISVRDRALELSNGNCKTCPVKCTDLACYESRLAYARKELEATHD
jgi:hypothetical protein